MDRIRIIVAHDPTPGAQYKPTLLSMNPIHERKRSLLYVNYKSLRFSKSYFIALARNKPWELSSFRDHVDNHRVSVVVLSWEHHC